MRFEIVKLGQGYSIRHKQSKVTFGPYSDRKRAKDMAKQLDDLMNSYKEFDEHFAAATSKAKELLKQIYCQRTML